MHGTDLDLPEIYLQPGQWRMVHCPSILKTVLGSCVGVTFRAPRIGAAAMCHPMLPSIPSRPLTRSDPTAARRYVDYVILEIAREFDKLGVDRSELEVKLFGGADVLASARVGMTVGGMNAEKAMQVLSAEGLKVLASRLGGYRGVFIEFHTGTGEVRLRKLAEMDVDALAQT